MSIRIRTALAIATLTAFVPGPGTAPLRAQDAADVQEPAPLVLTLDQALALAAGENPTLPRG